MSHVPERTCVGCRAKRPKAQLVRVVRRPDGTIEVDHLSRLAGRGAYFCGNERCWQVGLMKRGLDKTLRVKIPAATRDALLNTGHTMGVD